MSRIDDLIHGHPRSCHWPSRYAMEAHDAVLTQEQLTLEPSHMLGHPYCFVS